MAAATGAGEDVGVAVVEVFVVAEEVVDDELLFADVRRRSRAAAAHLLVQDGAANAAAHHKVQHLTAVEAGVEHADTDGDLRKASCLKRRIRSSALAMSEVMTSA